MDFITNFIYLIGLLVVVIVVVIVSLVIASKKNKTFSDKLHNFLSKHFPNINRRIDVYPTLPNQQNNDNHIDDSKISDLQHQLEQSETARQQQEKESEDKISELQQQLKQTAKESEAQVSELQQQLEKVQSVVEQQKKELSSFAENADPTRIAELMADAKFAEMQEQLKSAQDTLASTKKKLANAEDDLDDMEDECESIKKKLNQKEEEFQNTLAKQEEENKKTVSELTGKLESQKKDLTVKNGSLDFISSILTAQEVEDSDLSELYKNIDDVYSYVKFDFIRCLDKNDMELPPDDFNEQLYEWSLISKKTWIKNKTAIAFIGEFSAGKTSIVNSIITANNKNSQTLPVSAKATTAIPTYIAQSSTGVEQYCLFSPDNKLKELNPNVFSVTKEMLASVDGQENLIKYFVVAYNNESFKNLSILDTPGFSSEDEEDAKRTIEVINECDALFWVFDVNNGTVNRSSLKIIKEHLKKPLYVVINKIDTVAPREVDKVESLVSKTFAAEGIPIKKIIRYSNNAKFCPPSTIIEAISNVKQTNSSGKFIDKLRKYADSLLKYQDKSVEEHRKAWINIKEAVDNDIDDIQEQLNIIVQDCFDVAKMPQYKDHFFSREKYEMDMETAEKFVDLLDKIAGIKKDSQYDVTEIDKLTSLIVQTTKDIEDEQRKFMLYEEQKSKRKSLEVCIDGLKKRLEKIKLNREN